VKLREMEMTRDRQMKGSEERIHINMSDEKFDRDIVEMKEQLSVMMKLLQERVEEDQRSGWILKQKVKWPIKQLIARKLRHILEVWLKTEGIFSEVDYGQRSLEDEQEVPVGCGA
jgi:hypothetical protein